MNQSETNAKSHIMKSLEENSGKEFFLRKREKRSFTLYFMILLLIHTHIHIYTYNTYTYTHTFFLTPENSLAIHV